MAWYHRLLNLARSERVSRDIEREMRFHLDERAHALREAGMSDAHARVEARRRFGSVGLQAERTRDADVIGWLDTLRGDLRYALRALRRSPVFTIVAVGSLALGIGANTAIYTLVDAAILRPLPVPNPGELTQVAFSTDDGDAWFTNPLWEEVRDHEEAFTSIAAFGEGSLNRADGGEAQRIRALWVSGDFFTVIGLPPVAGRLLGGVDDVRGCPPIAVLGHGFWRSDFGASPDAVGRMIPLEGQRFEVVGVAPAGFTGPEVGRDVQVYLPLCSRAVIDGPRVLDARSSWWLRILGRRQPGLTVEQVGARLAAIAPGAYERTVPADWPAEMQADYRQRGFAALAAERGVSGVRTTWRGALVAMMGAVALVLLIACANVANLLLARAAAREREIAVRMAIGAGRGRLLRQLMTESILLAALGGAAGLLVAQWGARALVALISTQSNPVVIDLSLDPRVLAFTALAAALTATIFGLAPAWRATRVSPHSAMTARGRAIADGHVRFTLGKALVAAQVALSLVLLVGAGLMIGSLRNLARVDPGFRAEGVQLVGVDLSRTGSGDSYRATQRELLDRARAIPGVALAAIADLTPLGRGAWNGRADPEGEATGDEGGLLWFNAVSEGYFAAMDVRLLAGRDFGADDVRGGAAVAIVNESAARRLFGEAAPIGRRMRTQSGPEPSEPLTIVGIVEDTKYRDLRETSSATVFLPVAQSAFPRARTNLVLRTTGTTSAIIPAVRSAAAEVHPLVSLEMRTLSSQMDATLRRERMLAMLTGTFAAIALFLSMLGLYGAMAYAVARRRNELGVRIALGATRARVLRLVLGDVGRIVGLGVAAGLLGAWALSSVVRAFLFGIQPTDPATLVVAASLLAGVALVAGLIPARRAAAVDPVVALKEE